MHPFVAWGTGHMFIWLHKMFCYGCSLWESRCSFKEHCLQVLSSPEPRSCFWETLKMNWIEEHSFLCKVFYTKQNKLTLECHWEKSWEQGIFPLFSSLKKMKRALEHRLRSRSRMSALRTQVTSYFLTPAAPFGPWVQSFFCKTTKSSARCNVKVCVLGEKIWEN